MTSMVKGLMLTCLVCVGDGLKFNEPDIDLRMDVEAESYFESLKKVARIDYFRGGTCVHTDNTYRATYTVEKAGLKKGKTAKVNTCYRVERWWANHNGGMVNGVATSDGLLRGMSELRSDAFGGTEEAGGLKFTCGGTDKKFLLTHLYKADDCKNAFKNDDDSNDVINKHVTAADITTDWDECNKDLDANGAPLKYKARKMDTFKKFAVELEKVRDAALDARSTDTSITIGDDFLTVVDFTDLAVFQAKLKTSSAPGAEKIGLYVPLESHGDFGTGGATASIKAGVSGEGIEITDMMRKYNFKPPICP